MELSGTDSTNYLNYMVSGSVDSPASAAAATVNDSSSYKRDELNLPYAFCEVVVAVCAVIGNALVIIVFSKDRKLRRRTNYYIISLATADLLVGLFAIPFAILASIGLPTNLYACLFTVSVLVVLCTISIFCLVAVSIDRYWAILHPMGYSRNVRTKTAIGEHFPALFSCKNSHYFWEEEKINYSRLSEDHVIFYGAPDPFRRATFISCI